MSAQTRRIGAVLVNYRSVEPLTAILRSGALADVGQIVLVDNGDDPVEVTRLCDAHNAVPILLPTNVGFAAGVNAGLAVLQTELVLIVNPDIMMTSSDLECLLHHLDETGADGVAPLLREPGGRLQVGAGGGPLTAWSFAAYFLMVSHVLPVRGLVFTRRQSLRTQPAAWLSMACLLVRRSAFDRYGSIPEDELVYAEDVAWGTAATDAGARFVLASQVVVEHAHGSSGSSAAWIAAVQRLVHRRMPPISARIAVASMRLGLLIRRAMSREVSQR